MQQFDVLIIGAGLAGVTTALNLPETLSIAVIAKGALPNSASAWAQGGVAGVLADDDDYEYHIEDTLTAGAGLCERESVAQHVESAPELINWLIEQGVPFTTDEGQLHLHREGGHSHRRIVHVTDRTGAAIQEVLLNNLQSKSNITVFEHHLAVDLILDRHIEGEVQAACYGAYVHDRQNGETKVFSAPHVVLATGGIVAAYRYATNASTASGDGIAMAWRAGCRVANMEFMQFHPTCLFHPIERNFLITEAVRGEGGHLVLPDGSRFMPDHHELAELAPRDIVARAIDYEIKKRGLDCVYLDISHRGKVFLDEHFPTISKRCLELGIDISRDPIPVVPAAHYTCGGVVVDAHARTDLPGLYSAGESTYTGLHGANRLASNSLLECMVGGREAARSIVSAGVQHHAHTIKPWDSSKIEDPDDEVVISQNWDELRLTMWNYVGIVRSDKRLQRALRRLEMLGQEINEYYQRFPVSRDLVELRNLRDCAELVVRSAMQRRESRGLHYNLDCLNTLPRAMPTILTPAPRRPRQH
ncbi:MAG: L-aspartate oxidase [Gammaproteobacteria bacterium]|nr:L-aspartate oxidase [Gammaproteobacteria bacterium]